MQDDGAFSPPPLPLSSSSSSALAWRQRWRPQHHLLSLFGLVLEVVIAVAKVTAVAVIEGLARVLYGRAARVLASSRSIGVAVVVSFAASSLCLRLSSVGSMNVNNDAGASV